MRHMGNNECFRDGTRNAEPQGKWEYTVKPKKGTGSAKSVGQR